MASPVACFSPSVSAEYNLLLGKWPFNLNNVTEAVKYALAEGSAEEMQTIVNRHMLPWQRRWVKSLLLSGSGTIFCVSGGGMERICSVVIKLYLS